MTPTDRMDSCLRRNDGGGAGMTERGHRSAAPAPSFTPALSVTPAPSVTPALSVTPAPSVIPAQAGIHATAQPCDEPQSARRPTTAPSAPRVIGRRRTLGVPLTPTDRMDSCLRRNDGGGAGMTERGHRSAAPAPSFTPALYLTLASFRHTRPVRHIRPFRHSCGGRNPCDRPTVRRASIRPTAHHSSQRAVGDRAPSNFESALDPHRPHGFLPAQE